MFSDIYAAMGMKIVLSGTDSLGFWLAAANDLYDRVRMIHTSYIPYKEHRRLLGITDIDDYIRYGGSLKAGGAIGKGLEDSSFRDKESARVYLDTAIANNLQNSLAHFKDGYFRSLYPLYEVGELTNAIQRVVEDSSHRFLLSVLTKTFKSSDLGSVNQILRSEGKGNLLRQLDFQQVIQRLESYLDICDHGKVPIEEYHAQQILEYLMAMDVFDQVNICYLSNAPMEKRNILCIPGMRYCQCQALIAALEEGHAFAGLSAVHQKMIRERIEEDVLGRILEEVVLLQMKKQSAMNEGKEVVGTLRFADGEIDMYVYNKEACVCDLYEIKHSKEASGMQTRHLQNKEYMARIEYYFGKIGRKAVLYRGEKRFLENGIDYIPAADFLMDSWI